MALLLSIPAVESTYSHNAVHPLGRCTPSRYNNASPHRRTGRCARQVLHCARQTLYASRTEFLAAHRSSGKKLDQVEIDEEPDSDVAV